MSKKTRPLINAGGSEVTAPDEIVDNPQKSALRRAAERYEKQFGINLDGYYDLLLQAAEDVRAGSLVATALQARTGVSYGSWLNLFPPMVDRLMMLQKEAQLRGEQAVLREKPDVWLSKADPDIWTEKRKVEQSGSLVVYVEGIKEDDI